MYQSRLFKLGNFYTGYEDRLSINCAVYQPTSTKNSIVFWKKSLLIWNASSCNRYGNNFAEKTIDFRLDTCHLHLHKYDSIVYYRNALLRQTMPTLAKTTLNQVVHRTI